MSVFGRIGRSVGHTINVAGLQIVIAGLAATGAYLIGSQLTGAYEDNDFNNRIMCLAGIGGADCPSYGKELRDAEARRRAAERAEADALSRASSLQGSLDALKVVQNADNTFTIFTEYHEHSGRYPVQVATTYKSLVPPDASPKYGCYIALEHGDAGEDRSFWFRHESGVFRDKSADRRKAGISDSLWEYAVSVCKPTLIGASKNG